MRRPRNRKMGERNGYGRGKEEDRESERGERKRENQQGQGEAGNERGLGKKEGEGLYSSHPSASFAF